MIPSVRQATAIYKTEVRFKNKNTARLYHRGLDCFTEYIGETATPELPVSELKKNVVVSFIGWMAETRGYAAPTQRLYQSVLRSALRFWRANYEGWIRFSREEEQEAARTSLIGNTEESESRHERLPEDFGNQMLRTALNLPLPAPTLKRLKVLRTQVLIAVLRATALRIGDVCMLTSSQIEDARVQSGRLEVRMEKTGKLAHCRLGEDVLLLIDRYLALRDDNSPWLFIQHGKSRKRRKNSASFFRSAARGYGARLSSVSAWRIVQEVAQMAGFNRANQFTSPHAFRHWHAKYLIEHGTSLENVQAVLGHSTPATTRAVYAPEPDKRVIDSVEAALQALPDEKDQ